MSSDRTPPLSADPETRRVWHLKRLVGVGSLVPLIVVVGSELWLRSGPVPLIAAGMFAFLLISYVVVSEQRARKSRHLRLSAGSSADFPAVVQIRQLLESDRFEAAIGGLKKRILRRGWGQVGGVMTLGPEGVGWNPSPRARRIGLSSFLIPWGHVERVELVPTTGVGGGVGLEVNLARGNRLSPDPPVVTLS